MNDKGEIFKRVDALLQAVNNRRGACFATFYSDMVLEKGNPVFALMTIKDTEYGTTKENIQERDALLLILDPDSMIRKLLPEEVKR